MSTYAERLAAKGITLDAKPLSAVERYNLEQKKLASYRTGGGTGAKKKSSKKSKTKKSNVKKTKSTTKKSSKK